ncbi:MAG: hypothetical protein QM539_05680 [Alphaproteobacteria bacterium]|nr:hypothetical protein [Alphaproteobacteria bacterium]
MSLNNRLIFKLICNIIVVLSSKTYVLSQDSLQLVPPQIKTLAKGASQKIKICLKHQCLIENVGFFTLKLVNPQTLKEVDGWFMNVFPVQYFTTIKNQTVCQDFTFNIPPLFQPNHLDAYIYCTLPTRTDSVKLTFPLK